MVGCGAPEPQSTNATASSVVGTGIRFAVEDCHSKSQNEANFS
jgi:hypothetical protein